MVNNDPFNNGPGFFSGDFFFSFMTMIFPLIFLFVFGIIAYTIVKNIKHARYNSKQPRLSVLARVVTKRTQVRGRSHAHDNHAHTTSSTYYFATFEVESGDRMELELSGHDYGQIAEGDQGKLMFQGTKFLGFERI